jgi:hypothetical protein
MGKDAPLANEGWARARETKERHEMDLAGLNWSLLTIVGPLLLAAVILFALLRNRRSSQASKDRTEAATHRLYEEEEAARRTHHKGP